MLKWPNDIVWRHRKLGGLLTQLRSEAGGPAYVVVGLGLNLDLPPAARAAIDARGVTPASDLREALGGPRPHATHRGTSRRAMLEGLERFGRQGFAPFAAGGRHSIRCGRSGSYHAGAGSRGQRARRRSRRGVARRSGGRVERYVAGDVSLRAAPEPRTMKLLVDIGNSRVKWAMLEGGRLGPQQAAAMPAGRATTGVESCSRRPASTTCRGQRVGGAVGSPRRRGRGWRPGVARSSSRRRRGGRRAQRLSRAAAARRRSLARRHRGTRDHAAPAASPTSALRRRSTR